MIIKDLNINKLIFTQDELVLIEALLQKGLHRNIMSALVNIDPEKEIELQRIINILEPINEGFESEVRKLMNKKLPNGPQSPEEEAEWDAKLQAEYKEWVKTQERNRNEIELTLGKKPEDKETNTDDKNVSPDLSDELQTKQKEVSDKIKTAIKDYNKIKNDKTKKEEVNKLKEDIKTLKEELDSIK